MCEQEYYTQEMPLGSWNISVSRLIYPGNFIMNFCHQEHIKCFFTDKNLNLSKLTVLLLRDLFTNQWLNHPIYLVSLSDIKATESIQN